MRYALIAGAAILLLALSTIAILHSAAVDVWLYAQLARSATSGPTPQLSGPRELSVLLCGTGSPLPDKTRAGPCTLIAAGSHLYLVDAGLDSARNLLLWHVPLERIDAIFITHFHSDHIAELGELRLQTWVAGRKKPLTVIGPPGVEQVVAGFNQAYELDAGYRTAHHGADFLPSSAVSLVPVPIAVDQDRTATALVGNGLTVTAIRVRHDPARPAYGYRFDYQGRSIVVSGDTAPSENLAHAAKNTDVLVHEALSPELVGILHDAALQAGRFRSAKIFHDIPSYHTSPIDAAQIANEAHARLLVLTHLLPPVPNSIAERAFLRGVDAVRPTSVVLGHDGLIVHLPGRTDAIEQTYLD
jgi:ribonuclease Z